MPPVLLLSPKDVLRVFESFGWERQRQRGSHVILTKPGSLNTLAVPMHQEVSRGTLRSLIRASELSVEQFNERFKSL